MISHNEYVIWTIKNGTLRIAIGICDQTECPIVYLKDLEAYNEGEYNCYSYYEAPLSPEQAREIIEAAKAGNNRAVPQLIKKHVKKVSSCLDWKSTRYNTSQNTVSSKPSSA